MSDALQVLTTATAVLGIVGTGFVPLTRWALTAETLPDARLARAKQFRQRRREMADYLESVGETRAAQRHRDRGDLRLARAEELNRDAGTVNARLVIAVAVYVVVCCAVTLLITGLITSSRGLSLLGASCMTLGGIGLAVWGGLSAWAEVGVNQRAQERAKTYRSCTP